ncbi:NAD(P)-dependent oxidoreductase [Lysinibacillus irui]|uniref:NAD-dependent epimerase/dehydratase family protein n=1 Tax=Lysinibacillus irui TaxID=2998077 RepID=UPI00388478F4
MLLVTGITGHTGTYFLEELIKYNYSNPIRVLVRDSTNTTKLESSPLNMEIVRGDLNDKESLQQVIKGVESIIHIYNIHHSQMIVEEALRHNVKKVVLVHTTGVYSKFKEASENYKQIERNIEELLQRSDINMEVIILRPAMIYGDLCDHNISKFIKLIDRFKFIPVIDKGENLIQPVNARDLGKAYYHALVYANDRQDFDLTGDRPIQLRELFHLISKQLNKRIYIINVPSTLGVIIAKIIKIITFKKFDYVEKVQRMTENRSYSHEKAKRVFNYQPMSIEEGIQIEVGQYLDKKRGKKK